MPNARRSSAFPAIALTDRNGLYGAMPFSDACMGKGVQPIIGALLGSRAAAGDRRRSGASIGWCCCPGRDGYANLCKLVSSAHLDRPVEHDPHVAFAALEGLGGWADRADRRVGGRARAVARRRAGGQGEGLSRRACSGCFQIGLYIEIVRRGDPVEEAAEEALIDLAYDRDLPLVATNPAAYRRPQFPCRPRRHAVHRRLGLCRKRRPRDLLARGVAEGRSRGRRELFEDLPEAIANTAVIARRCAVAAPKRKPILPRLGDERGRAAPQATPMQALSHASPAAAPKS